MRSDVLTFLALISFQILHFEQNSKIKNSHINKRKQEINVFYVTFRVWSFTLGICVIGLGNHQLSFKAETVCTAL